MLSKEQLLGTVEYLLGTTNSVGDAVRVLELPEGSEEEILENVNDYGIELCESCDWWCEISELDEDNVCEDCRDA